MNPLLLSLSLLLWVPVSLAGTAPYVVIDLFTYSEPVPVTDVINNRNGEFSGGEIAFTHNWAEIGATYNNFGVGILGRYDYDLKFSEDTAEFYYLINNKKPLPQGRVFDLSLDAKHTHSEGVRLSYLYPLNKKTNITVGLSYLRGVWLTEGKAQGQGIALAENDYDFQFNVDYYYSEDLIFERKIDTPAGDGFSIDFALDWSITNDLALNLRVIDLIGRIYWENSPFTTATATSDVKEYDENGYLIYKPVLSGFETSTNFTQKLQPQVKALVNYRWTPKLAAEAYIQSYYIADFYQLGLRYYFSNATSLSTRYMFDTHAISVAYTMRYFNVMITSDALDFNEAHTLGLSLNVGFLF
ncbi:hypothetical protein [Kaarinaea lacus]